MHAKRPTRRFTPVPRARERHDGLTPARQAAFIDALQDMGSVAAAARAVGISPDTAYKFRRQPGAEAFALAWDEALTKGLRVLVDATMERAINGVPVPVMYRGRQVATRRLFNDKLAMFHLRHRLPEEYGGPHALPSAAARARQPGNGRFVTREEEEAQKLERIRQDHAAGERARASIRAKLDRIHAHFRQTLARDPARLAAYELLYGPGAPGDIDAHAGEGVHAGHLPPPLNYIIAGVATPEEVTEVFGPGRDGEDDGAD